jgi:N utilization substance protein A
MNFSELSRVIDQVGKDRGIDRKIIIEALEQAMLMAAKKKFGPTAELEAHWNEETGEVEIFQFKKIFETEDDIGDEESEITVEEARKLDPDVQVGDELGIKLDGVDFGRIDAMTAKQIIFQKVRDAERDLIFKEFIGRKGSIISGIARRVERGNLVIDLGRTEAYLPRMGIIRGETFRPGDRVQAFLEDVADSVRGPQLILSRTSPEFLKALFAVEVPEIAEGIVEIKKCVREPGERAKIAVVSNDRDVDPVGACVGMKGIRVQNVVQELKGEKIDIIPWNDDLATFVRSSMAPAEISMVRVIPATQTLELVVEDDQLSLAIGRKGQNVRLASQLAGWKVDIISKTKLTLRTKHALVELKVMEGLSDTLVQSLYGCGFISVGQIARCDIDTLARVPGFEGEGSATNLKEKAKKAEAYLKENPLVFEEEKKPEPGVGGVSVPGSSSETAKADANTRLKEEFAKASSGNKS